MSNDEQWASSCSGKVGFATKAKAEVVLRKTHRQGASRGKGGAFPIHPYRCRVCNLWHIGAGRPPRDRRRPRVELDDEAYV